MDRSRVPRAHRRQRDPAHRPRALAAQPRGGARQRAARDRRRHAIAQALRAARRDAADDAGARAHRLGARPGRGLNRRRWLSAANRVEERERDRAGPTIAEHRRDRDEPGDEAGRGRPCAPPARTRSMPSASRRTATSIRPLRRRQTTPSTSASAAAGSTRWRIASSAAARRGAFAQRAEAQPGAHRHQPERQRGHADALQRGGRELGKLQRRARCQQAGHVAMISGLRASSRRYPWPPWRASGHTAATLHSGTPARQQRHPGQALRAGQPLGQRQRDVRVEAEGRSARPTACARASTPGHATAARRPARCRCRARATPAAAEAAATPSDSGLRTIELNSSTGNST